MTDSVSTETAAHKPQPPAPVQQAIWCLWGSWLCGFARAPLTLADKDAQSQVIQQFMQKMSERQAQMPDGQEMPQLDPEMMGQVFGTTMYIGVGVFGLISLGITALILHKLKQGRDWARIVCLIYGALCALGLFSLHGFGLMSALTVGYLGLGYYALYLLFTAPGADWFRKRADAAPDAKW